MLIFINNKPVVIKSIDLILMNNNGSVIVDSVIGKPVNDNKVEGSLTWTPLPNDKTGIYAFDVYVDVTYRLENGTKQSLKEYDGTHPLRIYISHYNETTSPFGVGWNMTGLMRIIPFNTSNSKDLDMNINVSTYGEPYKKYECVYLNSYHSLLQLFLLMTEY